MFTIRKRSKEMCIGHRLINYSGACRNVHGHGIIIELTLQSNTVAKSGISIDFHHIGVFFDELNNLWDHAFLFNERDIRIAQFLIEANSKRFAIVGNPTMENLCKTIATMTEKFPFAPYLTGVTVYEKGGQDNVATFTAERGDIGVQNSRAVS